MRGIYQRTEIPHVCSICGSIFISKRGKIKSGLCPICRKKDYFHKRFVSKLRKTPANEVAKTGIAKLIKFHEDTKGCFVCTSHSTSKGYPLIYRNGKKFTVHNFIYRECFGEVEKGLVVRHKCDNPMCINPEHLEVGTRNDNIQDAVTRNRNAKGINQGSHKLSDEIVIFIRGSDKSAKELAKMFNVSITTIRLILKRSAWKHI